MRKYFFAGHQPSDHLHKLKPISLINQYCLNFIISSFYLQDCTEELTLAIGLDIFLHFSSVIVTTVIYLTYKDN